jgi:hypothetical protein
MALEGTLRDFSFADILQLISLQRKTGVLTLKNDDNVVTISFLEGCVVGSSQLSQQTEDRIGLILLKKGEITETELEAALKHQEETLQRLGRIFIDHRIVDGDVVRKALQQQILQIVYRVFRWGDGDYHFSQETSIDYDRDLMQPMAADSIIMEGARMTDEWPFIDQRIPDREVVFIKVNPLREFEVVDAADEDDNDFGFAFSDTPDDDPVTPVDEDRLTTVQSIVYDGVDGHSSVNEIIRDSPLIEFETCKALADLLDRGFIREATNEEISRQLLAGMDTDRRVGGVNILGLPWLALPFLILLGFSLSVMPRNPVNPVFGLLDRSWDGSVLLGSSWYRIERLSAAAESAFYLEGLYPETMEQVGAAGVGVEEDFGDPWGQPYRLSIRGGKLMVTGVDSEGQQVPVLIRARSLAWEGGSGSSAVQRPGVRLLR